MPDLNLMDEGGGFEESQTPAPAAAKAKGGGGGGGMKVVIIVVVLAVVVGGLWFANKKGWVKIPFLKKKEPVITQIQEDQVPEQPAEQMPVDTTNVSLLETAPVEQKQPVETKTEMKTEKPAQKEEMPAMSSPKLSEMSGKYTVQVFALHDQKNAEQIVARLSDAGYPAYVQPIAMKDANWYTVRIGKYSSRTDARKAVEAFALELRSSYFIDRVRSN